MVEAPPPPPERSNEELNLSVIRRHYPDVTSIRYVAPYAVLYAFSIDSRQWAGMNIEGTLFVCELVPSPIGTERYSVVILNRRGLENFAMEITGPEQIDIDEEYIIMQGDPVYGLWIFSEPPPSSTQNTRAETQARIMELAERAKASREGKEREEQDSEAADSDQVETSVPMGRQLSLRELFGQQRAQDSAWSVHNHHSSHPNSQALTQPAFMPTPSPQPAQIDVLNQLFMKAKQDYNGLG